MSFLSSLCFCPFCQKKLYLPDYDLLEVRGPGCRGLYYFQNSSFFIKPDLRDLSFLTGGLMQFFFYKMQVVFL